jgi:hypothetical protein
MTLHWLSFLFGAGVGALAMYAFVLWAAHYVKR